jgi:hypothetical protein
MQLVRVAPSGSTLPARKAERGVSSLAPWVVTSGVGPGVVVVVVVVVVAPTSSEKTSCPSVVDGE